MSQLKNKSMEIRRLTTTWYYSIHN